MNYNKIVQDIKKYHFLYVYNKKVIILASSDTLEDAKEKTLTKIQSKLSVFKDNSIVRFKIKKINKKTYEESKKTTLTSIGGPIIVDINVYRVSPNGKIKMDDTEDRNNTLYFTESFLKNNKKIKNSDLKLIALNTMYNKLDKSILAINTIDNLVISTKKRTK